MVPETDDTPVMTTSSSGTRRVPTQLGLVLAFLFAAAGGFVTYQAAIFSLFNVEADGPKYRGAAVSVALLAVVTLGLGSFVVSRLRAGPVVASGLGVAVLVQLVVAYHAWDASRTAYASSWDTGEADPTALVMGVMAAVMSNWLLYVFTVKALARPVTAQSYREPPPPQDPSSGPDPRWSALW